MVAFADALACFGPSCACVALSVPVFSLWLRVLSRLDFHKSLSIAACSVVLTYAVAFLGVAGFVSPALLSVVFSVAGSLVPFAYAVRAYRENADARLSRFSVAREASLAKEGRLALQARIVSIASECCSGLYLFVMSAVARTRAFDAGAIPPEYRTFEMLALPLGALFVLVLLRVKRGRAELSQVQSEYLPIFAALFFVLCSFGAETPLFGIGFLLSQAALGALVVLAIVSIASLWSKGEASIVVLSATVLGGLLLALVFGQIIALFVEPESVGAVLLVIASIYFSGVMLNALASLRALVESMANGTVAAADATCGLPRTVDLPEVCEALADEKGLSPREREILRFVAGGHTSPYIASKLVISEYTVRTHMRNMYRKVGVSSKEELIQLVEAKRTA